MMEIKSIRYNMIMNVVLAASGVVIPLITYPYVTRVFSPEELGKVAFASNVIFYYRLVAQLGVPTYGISQCAKVRENKEELSKLTTQLGFINIITTIFAVILLAVSIALFPTLSNYSLLLAINCIDLIFGTLNFEWFYKGLEQFDYITKRSLFCRVLIMLLTFILIRDSDDYYLYALLSVISSMLIWICNIKNVRQIVFFKRTYIHKNEVILHMKPIVILCATSLSTTIYTSIDTVMIGYFCGDAEVGIYSVAIKIKTILVTLITSAVAIYLPRMSKYYKEGDIEKFGDTLSRGIQLVVMVSLPVVLFFYSTSALCIEIIAGEQYLAAVTPMKILMPTILLIGTSSLIGTQVLVAMGRQNKYLMSTVIASIVDIVINFILVPKIGSAGAAIGTFVAEILVLALQIFFICDVFENVLKKIRVFKSIVAGVCSLIIINQLQVMVGTVGIGIILGFIILFVVFVSVYLLIMLILRDKLFMEIFVSIRATLLRRRR